MKEESKKKDSFKSGTQKVGEAIGGVFTKVKNSLTPIDKREYDFSAKQAWTGSTYGKERCLISIEQQIKDKRNEIRADIERKYRGVGQCFNPECDYFHIVQIEGNLHDHAEDIVRPFIEVGFEVVNLSDLTKVLEGTKIYLISWRNAFKKGGGDADGRSGED